MAFFVFDLDGTLALNEHPQHFLEKTPKDWDGFFEACSDDAPNWPVITALNSLQERHQVEIWSGRSEAVRGKTEAWLLNFNMNPDRLKRMRPVGDFTPDDELKMQWLKECGERRPWAVFDDRAKVVAMWREAGIACFQVAEGNF